MNIIKPVFFSIVAGGYKRPLLKRVLSGEFKANDVSALLIIIGFVVMALASVKIVENHKNKKYFGARNHYVYLVLFSGMYIMHVLPNVSGEPSGLIVLRDVENDHEMATLVMCFLVVASLPL